jgi:hypothetical protein
MKQHQKASFTDMAIGLKEFKYMGSTSMKSF